MQDQLSTTRKRPLGITIIAILLFIQAVITIIGGILIFIGSVVVSSLFGLGQPNHTLLGALGGSLVAIIIVIYMLVDGNVRRAFGTGI